MMCPLTNLHEFGFRLEQQLKTRLEEALAEPIIKTSTRFAQMDFLGANYFAELKCRQKPVKPGTYSTWLLPYCKKPKELNRETVYFYYFEADDSLWYLFYDKDQFESFERAIPHWHKTQQEHYYIPAEAWSKLE